MSDIKESTISLIKNLPDDITIDDILDAINLRKKIMQGVNDLDKGDSISDAEMQQIIDKRLREL